MELNSKIYRAHRGPDDQQSRFVNKLCTEVSVERETEIKSNGGMLDGGEEDSAWCCFLSSRGMSVWFVLF
jgi:hypothetical protein